jgi:hypothetical protein
MIGYCTSVTSSLNRTYYSAIADLLTFQSIIAHALGFSVFTSRLLATDLNIHIVTSNQYEAFLSSISLCSSGLICTQVIFTLH